MSAGATRAVAINEWNRVDVTRTALALLAAVLCGRLIGGSGASAVFAGIVAVACVASQLMFLRDRSIPIPYLEAPMSGTALACALAAVPCTISLALEIAFVAGCSTREPVPSAAWAAAAEAALLGALIVQSARLRIGNAKALYRTIACAAVFLTVALNATLPPPFGFAAFGLVAMAALRDFGETLTRFDPVVTPL